MFSNELLGEIAVVLLGVVSLIVLLKYNLFFATNIKNTTMVAAIFSMGCYMVIYGGMYLTEQEFSIYQNFSNILQPDFMHFGQGISVDQYLVSFDDKINLLDKIIEDEIETNESN